MKKNTPKVDLKKALSVAKKAQKNSHSPYSQKKIGASVVLSNGAIVGGCNIENASYGGTVCAERVAIWKAKSEFPKLKIDLICVLSPGNPPWPPCGFCRQVMVEFCAPETKIICMNDTGQSQSFSLGELLPKHFSSKDLK
ncbi:MAG: cytidine deaminase [Pseudobdellovibrionaceae bacterium]